MLLLDGVGLHVVESELKQCIQRHLDWLDDIVLTVDESTWLRWSKQRRSNAAKCQIRQQFNNSGVAGGNKNQKQLNCKAEYKHERAPLNRDFYEQGAPPNRGVGQKRRLEMNRAKLVAQNVLRAVKRRRPTGPSPGARRPSALVASPGARCPANSAVNNVQILHNPNRRLNQTVTTAMSRTPSHIRVVANHHDDRKLDIVTDRAVPSVNNTEHHAPSSSVNCTNNGGITIKQEEGNSCHDDSVECQQQTDGAASESSSGDNDCDTAPPSENKPIPPITYFNAVKLEPDDTDYYTINDDVITDNDQQQYGFTIPAGSSGVGSGGAGSGEENGPIPGTSAQITDACDDEPVSGWHGDESVSGWHGDEPVSGWHGDVYVLPPSDCEDDTIVTGGATGFNFKIESVEGSYYDDGDDDDDDEDDDRGIGESRFLRTDSDDEVIVVMPPSSVQPHSHSSRKSSTPRKINKHGFIQSVTAGDHNNTSSVGGVVVGNDSNEQCQSIFPELPQQFVVGDSSQQSEQFGDVYYASSTATDHQRSPGADKSKKRFGCDQCMATFASTRNLRRHKLIHTGVRPFKCDYCDKAYCRRDQLKMHMTSNHLERFDESTDNQQSSSRHMQDNHQQQQQHALNETI
ncbi:uncharacterized protein LOC141909708 [Tubulanus polymorphus]|uniref:uncharacterized protein LOC141909708 n=1 Tax=Tubulanus polymorphus TaxID=672921 RepID=UPI003DA2BECE